MKNLLEYILEETTSKIKATLDWMKEHYVEFNKLYFNNELPSIDNVDLRVTNKTKKDTWLGQQGEHCNYFLSRSLMRNDMYQMFTERKTTIGYNGYLKYVPNEDSIITDITKLKPYIYLSARYIFDELELEDTLIHEMIHLWVSKDGLAPKQAHGKEFRKKCKEIRELAEKNGKYYHLTTYATDHTKYNYSDEEKQVQKEIINKRANKGGGIILVYFKLDKSSKKRPNDLDRFLFTTKNCLTAVIKEIKQYHKRNEKIAGKIIDMRIADNLYIDICNEYDKFKTVRTYRYWNISDYPKVLEMLNNDKDSQDILNENMNEAKKTYVKPMTTVIEIPKDMNMSDINLEDILNKYEENDVEEQDGSDATNKKLITVC